MKWMRFHFLQEEEKDGHWESAHYWQWNGPTLFPRTPLYRSTIGTEKLLLFSILTGGYLGIDMEERPPIQYTKPLPEDLATETRKYLAQFDAISPGMLPPKSVLNYPWKQPVARHVRATKKAYEHWKTTEVIPANVKEAPEASRTEEIVDILHPEELWGLEWLRHSLPRIESMNIPNTRLIYFLTEEEHG